MKNLIVLIFLMAVQPTDAQVWNDLNYSPDQAGLEENPLKGFMDLYGPTNDFPRSINGKLFGLNQVMLGLDNFNWTAIDNFIAQNRFAGDFTYLQVNIDPGPDGNNVPRSYMPAFLNGQYDFVTVDGPVADICPDWNDPEIMEAMLNFIEAFGERYDAQPEVFMVVLGLYGIYGEWQIGDAANIAPEFEMTLQNKVLLANAFKKAFPNTNLLARYPEPMPDPEIFGYSDGLFFSQSISTNTFFNHFYFDNTIELYNAGQNWRTQILGGEIDPCIQPSIWKNWPNLNTVSCDPNNPSGQSVDVQDVVQTINATHPTFLISHHVFTGIHPINTPQEWENAIKAQKLMGYNFYIDQYRLSASGGVPVVEVNIQNKGVAPMYANWEVELGSINTVTDEFQSLGTQKWNLNIIQPDAIDNYRAIVAQNALSDGDYIFLLRIVNPLTASSSSANPVRFANETQDANNQKGWLTLGAGTISSGTMGTVPIVATDLSLSQSTATLTVGETLQLTSTISPSNATNQTITWASDKPGTASVNANGLVTTGPAYGNVKITAYPQGGGLPQVCEIQVAPKSVAIPAVIKGEAYIRMNGIVPGLSKLGFIDNGDWMDYSVSVAAATNFLVDIHASCPDCNDNLSQNQSVGIIHIINENGELLDEVRLPKTNGFSFFKTITSDIITLPVGTHKIRFEAKAGNFDLRRLEFIEESLVGIESIEGLSNNIAVFPNPTSGKVMLKKVGKNINKLPNTIELINIYGQKIQSVNVINQSVNLTHLTPGVYFLKAQIDKKSIVKRILKY